MKNLLLVFVFITITTTPFYSQTQCPDNMHFFPIGSSYFFYNDPGCTDLCAGILPATITVDDNSAFCGPATFSINGTCPAAAGAPAPFNGQAYVQTDPVCFDPQIDPPLTITWGSCNCTYGGPAPVYTLMQTDCSGTNCPPICPDPGTCDDGDCTNGTETWDNVACACVSGPPPQPCTDDGNCNNGIETWDTNTCVCFVFAPVFGCTDPTASNYDPAANCDDGMCVAGCPMTLNIPDNPVLSGLYEASVSIISTGFVPPVGNVDYEAGTVICLDNGFTVHQAGNFSAVIAGCP